MCYDVVHEITAGVRIMATTTDRLAAFALVGAILAMPVIYDTLSRLVGSP